jgi:acyl-CoA thioesterase
MFLGFNAHFLRGCKEGKTVRSVGRVLHKGRSTMVVEGGVFDPEDRLLARGRGTFWVTGEFTPEDLRGEGDDLSVKPEARPNGENPQTVTPDIKNMTGWLKDLLLLVHDRNYFARYLGMEIRRLCERYCVVTMLVTDKHVNMRGVVHGGALASLADMSMMLACATLGKRTVTLDLNINFVRRVREGTVISSFAQVIHKGKATMVARSTILDPDKSLLAEARGTFFVIGDYTPEETA